MAPVTLFSLRGPIEGGARSLYPQVTGGNHQAAWMGPAQNPLLAKWAYPKGRAGAPTVVRAPRADKAWKRNGSSLAIGVLPELSGKAYTLTGQGVLRGSGREARLGAQVYILRDRK